MLTEAQHALRRQGIGSSDIAAILGEDPMKSALDVWLDKTGRAGKSESTPQSELGHDFEPVIADRFARAHKLDVEVLTTIQLDDPSWAIATPDRWIRDSRELIETKNVGYRMMRKWAVPSGWRAPNYVQLQGQWQCLVANSVAFWVVALIGGRDFYEERFDFDPELGQAMLDVAGDFWTRHVLQDIEPEPDGSQAAKAVLERLYPRANGFQVEPTVEIQELARSYGDARRAEKAAKLEKECAGNKLRAALGSNLGTIPAEWGVVEWREKKGRTDWRKVAGDLGAPKDLIAKHTGEPTRTLNVKLFDEDDSEDE